MSGERTPENPRAFARSQAPILSVRESGRGRKSARTKSKRTSELRLRHFLTLKAARLAIIWKTQTMGLFAEKFETLRDLYVNELRDLHSAEQQLISAIPKMAEAATSSQLKKALTSHLEQTRGHVRRLEQILDALGEKPSGKTCEAMKGLIAEGESYVKASGDDSVRDAGLIGAAQRVEHYEIAGYGTARSLANRLGEKNAADLLQRTLEEEGDADHKLSEIAEGEVNVAASSSRAA
jgi:ferritin-like metal-binding protein YciE